MAGSPPAAARALPQIFFFFAFASTLGTGCSDVGDSTALPNPYSAAQDVTVGDDYGGEAASDSAAEAAEAAAVDATIGVGAGSDAQSVLSEESGIAEAESPDTASGPSDSSVEAGPDTGAFGSTDGAVEDAADGAPSVDGAVQDASLHDASEDSSVADSSPGEHVDSGTSDAATETPDAGKDSGADAGASSGPLVPCTTAAQTNCVSCPGSTGSICTPTEADFVQLDIDQGVATAPGPDPANGCYECLLGGGCLDEPKAHYTGLECEDLTGDFTNAAGDSVVASAACEATLQCEIGPQGDGCAASPDGLSFCYCGTGGGPPSACEGVMASAVNGACVAQEIAGFNLDTSDPNNPVDIVENYTDVSQPSGLANNILSCADANSCTTCLQ